MVSDKEGFLQPKINQDSCTDCGLCKKVCPVLHKPARNGVIASYACYDKDMKRRMCSSSGGVFRLLAEHIVGENGVVIGAAFDASLHVKHVAATCLDDLKALQGSKYVQSEQAGMYGKVKKYLFEGKMVLYSGTPCQIAGLKSYLGKEHDNLFCIDLICHGVPSPKVWERYLIEKGNGKDIIRMRFRNKENGIENTTLDYELEDGTTLKEAYAESAFIMGFVQNLYVRNSCHCCKFKGYERSSDITLGDFWGLRHYYPDFGDNYGISAMLIHTAKGQRLLASISMKLECLEVLPNDIAAGNELLLKSAKRNHRREEFFSRWESERISELIHELDNPLFFSPESRSIVIQFVAKTRKLISGLLRG